MTRDAVIAAVLLLLLVVAAIWDILSHNNKS